MKTCLILLSSIVMSSTASVAQLSQQADTLFRYDRSAPLDLRDSLIEATKNYRVYESSYASPRIGRATGYIVTAAAKGRYAGIVFGHWGLGNRAEFLPEAKLYAEAGAVSLIIDYPWVWPAPYRVRSGRGCDEPEKDLAVYSQAVVDLRRGIDVLMSRSDVRVERHTDNVSISDKLTYKFLTNWELSRTRASNVVRFLQETVLIDPTRLEAVGLSEFHPVASNATANGRSQNRRIEIALLPDPRELATTVK